MSAAQKVELFLKNKMENNGLRRAHIAYGAQVSHVTINNIVAGDKRDVTFGTILKLANYFECSLDEVLGREMFLAQKKITDNTVTNISAMGAIKEFLKTKMKESGEDIYNFTKNCGLYKESLRGFLTREPPQNSINANHLLIIVDHFNISLDVLVRRSEDKDKVLESGSFIKTGEQKLKNAKSNHPIIKNLPLEDQYHFEKITSSLKPHQTKPEDKVNTGNSPTEKVKKTSHNR